MARDLSLLNPIVVTGQEDTAGTTALVAAPAAGQQHLLSAVILQAEAVTANTIKVLGAAVELLRCYAPNAGDGIAIVFPPGREIPCGSACAININLSAAAAVGYTIVYYTDAV